MGFPVNTPDMVPGLAFIDEATNLSTARRKIDLSTTPAKSITIKAMNLGAASAQVIYAVFNAVSDSEATTKLGVAGQRYVIPVGESLTVAFAEGVSRVDLIAKTAESGANLVVTTAVGG